jgi:hypothetical protein
MTDLNALMARMMGWTLVKKQDPKWAAFGRWWCKGYEPHIPEDCWDPEHNIDQAMMVLEQIRPWFEQFQLQWNDHKQEPGWQAALFSHATKWLTGYADHPAKAICLVVQEAHGDKADS